MGSNPTCVAVAGGAALGCIACFGHDVIVVGLVVPGREWRAEAGRFHFYHGHNRKKTSYTSPAERQRVRRDSDGTGLCSPIMRAALAAMRPIEARVGLHEDGCRAGPRLPCAQQMILRALHSTSGS